MKLKTQKARKVLSVTMILCMLLGLLPQFALPARAETAVWDGTTDTTWYNSTDTEFTITTAEQLAGLASLVHAGNPFSGKTVTLGADIVLNDVSNVADWATSEPSHKWTPIGEDWSHFFAGIFDGGGHKVSGIYISTTSHCQGLFGYIDGGTVQNVGVVDSYISCGGGVGGVVGCSDEGKVEYCYNAGSVSGNKSCVGGVGGVVGCSDEGKVEYCYNAGSVSGGTD